MIWDDIDPDVFIEQPDLYRMFKVGYSRQTDRLSIASSGGKNINFRVFCPKIFSSIHPFFSDSSLSELNRRLMFVSTKKATLLGRDELLDLTIFSWKHFKGHYAAFWQNEANCQKFADYRKTLARKKPTHISPEQWQVSIDLLTTGLTFGIFLDTREAMNFINEYWESHEQQVSLHKGALYELLEILIKQEIIKINDLALLGLRLSADGWVKIETSNFNINGE